MREPCDLPRGPRARSGSQDVTRRGPRACHCAAALTKPSHVSLQGHCPPASHSASPNCTAGAGPASYLITVPCALRELDWSAFPDPPCPTAAPLGWRMRTGTVRTGRCKSLQNTLQFANCFHTCESRNQTLPSCLVRTRRASLHSGARESIHCFVVG